eukprot:243273-Pelagomonas_calceolata.AAC.9
MRGCWFEGKGWFGMLGTPGMCPMPALLGQLLANVIFEGPCSGPNCSSKRVGSLLGILQAVLGCEGPCLLDFGAPAER